MEGKQRFYGVPLSLPTYAEECFSLPPDQAGLQMRSSCIMPQRLGYVFVFVEPEYPYHQIHEDRHYARSRFRPDLTEVFMESNIPHIVQSVFNGPVPTVLPLPA